MQEKVNKWIAEGCDFDSGIAILSNTGRYKQLVKIISNRSYRYADKLRYELLKAAGLNTGLPVNKSLLTRNIPGDESEPHPDDSLQSKSSRCGQLPSEVEKVIKFHADAFKTRAILHEAMANLPNDNTDALITQRKELSDQIAECSEMVDVMWKAKEDFYVNNIIPDIKALIAEKQTEENQIVALPFDLEELKKMKKNLQSANTKDQFMLDYRQTTRGEKKNPLPDSPKRIKIELRMKQRDTTIEAIDYKLVHHSK
jgi:uncharacterized membrane-anchored protein YhcB (DUF1043 family)